MHNTSIQGLRGLAALAVVMSHIGAGGITSSMESNFPNFFTLLKLFLLSGQYGVELFFIISGYLISASLEKSATVNQFIKNRIIRIYPVFLTALVLIFSFGPIVGYSYFLNFTSSDFLLSFVLNFFFIPGVFPMVAALGVAWSLSYEALFYIISAAFKFLQSKFVRALIIILIFITVLALPRAIFFVIGFIVFKKREFLSKNITIPPIFETILLILFFISLFFSQYSDRLISVSSSFFSSISFGASMLIGFIYFSSISLTKQRKRAVLDSNLFHYLGLISYSLYIWHTLIMFATKRVSQFIYPESDIDRFVIFSLSSIMISLIVSHFSYLYLEAYFTAKFHRSHINQVGVR